MADPPSRKRPRNYQKFDPETKKLRQALVESLATSCVDHINSNGGKCRRNFVKDLISRAASTTAGLNITRHDVGNACRRRWALVSSVATPSPVILLAAGFNDLSLLATT